MLSEDFLGIYERLLNDVKELKTWPKGGLCACAPLRGASWEAGDVIFYGRAQNGWVRPSEFCPKDVESEDARAKKAREICEAGHVESICTIDRDVLIEPCEGCGDPQMHWVRHPRKKEFYHYENLEKGTRFWNVVGRVVRKLHRKTDEESWVPFAAWSNLYKVAPVCGGNPETSLIARQHGACAKLVEIELSTWLPRAAVFLTETNKRESDFTEVDDAWFGRFRTGLNVDSLRPVLGTPADKPVHTGWANVAGQQIQVVVALRPEHLSPEVLSGQIFAAIQP